MSVSSAVPFSNCTFGASLALTVALLLALRQQRRISQPLESLAAVAQRVAQTRDFSLRAPTLHLQELQVLSSTFNTGTSATSGFDCRFFATGMSAEAASDASA